MDSIHGLNQWTQSMDSLHGLNPWTQSMDSLHRLNPWTQFKTQRLPFSKQNQLILSKEYEWATYRLIVSIFRLRAKIQKSNSNHKYTKPILIIPSPFFVEMKLH